MYRLAIALVCVVIATAVVLLVREDAEEDFEGGNPRPELDTTDVADTGDATPAVGNPVATQPYDESTTQRGVIGRVVTQAGGEPVAEARVTVRTWPDGMQEKVTTTRADGRFRVTGLDFGKSLAAFVHAKGFGALRYSARVPDGTEDVDCGDLELTGGMTVIGRIIEADTGRAIPQARIRIRRRWVQNELMEVATTSSSDGAFRVPDVPIQNRQVAEIEADGWARRRIRLREAETKAGATYDLGDIALGRGTDLVGEVVTKASGAPVAAALLLADQLGSDHILAPSSTRLVGRSEANGRFHISNLPAAESEKYVLFAMTGTLVGWVSLGKLAGTGSKELRIEVEEGAPLVVRVEEQGRPVAGAEVNALPRLPGISRWGGGGKLQTRLVRATPELLRHAQRVTGQNGVARLEHLPIVRGRRRIDVVVWKEGYVLSRTEHRHPGPGQLLEITVPLERKVYRRVHGVVRDDAGVPIAGAEVGMSYLRDRVPTDEQGRYELKEIEPSSYPQAVVASKEGFASSTVPVNFESGPDQELDIALVRGRPVAGRVIDDQGAPVPQVGLMLARSGVRDGQNYVRTDDEGRFSFPPIPSGDWVIRVNTIGEGGSWVRPFPTVELTEGRDDIVLTLKRYAGPHVALFATVVDARTKKPLEVVYAQVRPAREPRGARHVPPVETRLGEVTSPSLGPGRWTLRVKVSDGRESTREFEVLEGETRKTLEVKLTRAGRITVRVSFDGPRPRGLAAWATHQAFGADPRWQRLPGVTARFAPVGDDGIFRFMEIKPGPFYVRVTGGQLVGELLVTMPAAGDLTAEVRLVRAGHVRFSGPAPDGCTSVDLQVRQVGSESGFTRGASTKDGTFDKELMVVPGDLEWRALFRSANGKILRTRSGTVAVGSSGVAFVRVPP